MNNTLLLSSQNTNPIFTRENLTQKIKSSIFLFLILFSSSLFSQTTIILPADQTSWYVPCDVTTITVEVWGAGGGGQSVTGNGVAGRGGGGSGGGYVRNSYTVTPNSKISYSVGIGGNGSASAANDGSASWFSTPITLLAVGGKGAATMGTGSGTGSIALTSGNVGGTTVSTYGGNGGNATSTTTGGGGASAGNAKGNNANGATGGAAAANSYAGANGINSSWGDGVSATIGAGGSGSKKGTSNDTWKGGSGGPGQIRITYTSSIPSNYCTKVFLNSEPITNVTFGGINNTSSPLLSSPAYESFCGIPANIAQGQTYPVSLKGNTDGDFTDYFTVFIDLNRNGSFADAGERFDIGTIKNSTGTDALVATNNILIPFSATLGLTKMRVAKHYNSYPDDCDPQTYGQVEDYVINITSPPACTGTPSGGLVTLTPNSGAPSSVFVASVAGGSGGTGLTYQWESATSAGGPWTNVTGATTATANITAVNTPGTTTYYKRKITCSGLSGYSDTKTFVTGSGVYKVPATGNETITTCSGTIYDNGGTGQYNNSSNGFTIIKPATAGALVRLNVVSYNVERSYPDYVTIYDGEGTTGEILAGGFIHTSGTGTCRDYKSDLPSQITSKTGSLTVKFQSDTGTPCDGFEFTISCFTPTPCSGAPTAGTFTLSSSTGAPLSAFTATASAPSTDGGLIYQWQIAETSSGPWTDIAGQTKINAGFTAVPTPNTTRIYRRKVTCTNSGLVAYTPEKSFTTNPVTYCTPTVSSGYATTNYITSVAFKGTLVEAENIQATPFNNTTAPIGYQDYTGLPKSVQAQGGGVNVLMVTTKESLYKAWIDWNGDGDFTDLGENIYNAGGTGQFSTTIGFKIPDNAPPGDYRIRIRTSSVDENFSSCGDISQNGETEDYLFTVVANCWSMVTGTTEATGCAGTSVDLKAESSGVVTEFRWYDAIKGGSLVGTSLPDGAGKTVWTTPILSATKTFYVTAYGGCESLSRVPAKAFINPVPVITFTPSSAKACGDNSIVRLSASGNNQTDWLINDNFQAAGTGKFVPGREYSIDTGGPLDIKTQWTKQSSAFVANGGTTWTPAVASGAQGNNFLFTTSDIGSKKRVETTLTSIPLDTGGFNTLRFKFRMYYSRYFKGLNEEPLKDFVKIQVSDNGAPWVDLDYITRSIGEASNFAFPGESAAVPFSYYDLNAYKGKTNFKLRILYYADDWCDGVAIDDVELYGEKDLAASFSWTKDHAIDFYADAAATVPYSTTSSTAAVYIKPSPDQMEQYTSWNINATALLNNGCTATGKVQVENFSKIWNNAGTSWNTPATWKPTNGLPDLSTCVIVRTPLIVDSSLNPAGAMAKSITIIENGKLTVNTGSALTVNDEIINRKTVDRLIVQNDANLVQNTDAAVNVGPITVNRNSTSKREDYTYWASPVKAQQLKAFSTGTLDAGFYTYNETDDKFYHIPPTTNVFGNNSAGIFESAAKGYGIRANNSFSNTVPSVFEGSFKGVPNNGLIPFALQYRGASGGYNLVGNPYSSNINFTTLVADNSTAIEGLAYFWTNINPNGPMQGSNYPSGGLFNNYAILNLTGGIPATSSVTSQANNTIKSETPTNIIKVGQGFIVKALGTGKTLNFKNATRSISSTSNFFSKGVESKEQAEVSDDRYWIHLTTPLGVVTTALVGYKKEATNQFDTNYDAELPVVGSDALYTTLADFKLGIQGRKGPLVTDDVVQLGTSHYADGSYVFSLGEREGIFTNGQKIYLRDKETGMVTNLMQNNYSFVAKSGQTNGRFELIYKSDNVLATSDLSKENLVVYKDGRDFVIKSADKKITNIEMYDVSGRLMYKEQSNNYKIVIPAENFAQGVYILKINQEGEITSRKVLK
ncbi:T9SS type A sorting domain-containing protein [Chryseobacterium sp. SNU WT5]|uniref:GEVED domain-containing protein n=1 Tax=Chryseobacterium sp. SNU WT5 TaxID=2594269 RepID=UPI0011800BA2|nr:GEVED domain-containing protein [Chryseobacterium sp. SNU WT5]QDP85825.1 T9SS type A sorting domain-containing protein [Chryseobacterium sp. SNU WT5]